MLHNAIHSCRLSLRLLPILERQSCVDQLEKTFISGIMSVRLVEKQSRWFPLQERCLTRVKDMNPPPFHCPPLMTTYVVLLVSVQIIPWLVHCFCGEMSWNPGWTQLNVLPRLRITVPGATNYAISLYPKDWRSWIVSCDVALDNYRNHFESQFRNEHGIPPSECTPAALNQSTELSVALMTFQRDIVQQMIPGASGMHCGSVCLSDYGVDVRRTQNSCNNLVSVEAITRFRDFPIFVNIQLYAAFVRPGLEYVITLVLWNRSSFRLSTDPDLLPFGCLHWWTLFPAWSCYN